ncbi:MAG: hypothetical protein AB7Q00_14710 [Phycisphaerales bacterium]
MNELAAASVYITKMFHKQFPYARMHVRWDNPAESWYVTVTHDNGKLTGWVMQVGSDDDCYRFTNLITGEEYVFPLEDDA